MLEFIYTISIAAALGGLIGFEREFTRRPAGLRTHILVSVAAAVLMYINLQMYEDLSNVDPGRFGAQVISGIGFLGAGTILKEGVNVRGLTTAASLWSVAAIGLLVGYGHYLEGLAVSVLIFMVLLVLSKAEHSFHYTKKAKITLFFEVDQFDMEAFSRLNLSNMKYTTTFKKNNEGIITFYAKLSKEEEANLLDELRSLSFIKEISTHR